jgi:hypothetical protein
VCLLSSADLSINNKQMETAVSLLVRSEFSREKKSFLKIFALNLLKFLVYFYDRISFINIRDVKYSFIETSSIKKIIHSTGKSLQNLRAGKRARHFSHELARFIAFLYLNIKLDMCTICAGNKL